MIQVFARNGGYSRAVSDLTISSSENTLGLQVEFNLLFRGREIVKVGDPIWLHKNGDPFLQLKVIDIEKVGKKARRITCFDYGFYLNQNEVVIQFNNIPADEAIKRLCNRFNINYKITSLPYKIDKIYKGEAVSDIIKDILEQCTLESGVKYFFEVQNTTLVVASIYEYDLNLTFNLVSNPSVTESMRNMKNKIVVVNDDTASIAIEATVQDDNSIAKFGLLQKVEQVNDDDKGKATKIAQELLKELNKIEISSSLEILGNHNFDILANRIIRINEPVTGLVGRFYIKSANHRIKSSTGLHIIGLEVGAI